MGDLKYNITKWIYFTLRFIKNTAVTIAYIIASVVLVTFLCKCNSSSSDPHDLIDTWSFYQSIDGSGIHWSGSTLKIKDNNIYDWKGTVGYWECDDTYIWMDKKYEYSLSNDDKRLVLRYAGPSVQKYSYTFNRR